MMIKNHYYPTLIQSPWPVLLSLSSGFLTMSMIIFFKYAMFYNLLMSIMYMTLLMFLWWTEFGMEINIKGFNSFVIENSIKFSMLLFISSEIFFFFSFFWSYFHFFLAPNLEISMCWPPQFLGMFKFQEIPMLNTFILLLSGITLTISHNYLNMNLIIKSNIYMIITLLLGFSFSIFQLMEYKNSFFSINDSIFGSNFYILTGFHGLHVLIGATYLMVVLMRLNFLSLTSSSSFSFDLSSWYWHFVDVVWLFLFYIIYYANNI